MYSFDRFMALEEDRMPLAPAREVPGREIYMAARSRGVNGIGCCLAGDENGVFDLGPERQECNLQCICAKRVQRSLFG
jgi:hypothetical protein